VDISIHKLYSYDHVYQLLALAGNMCLCSGDNGPMNTKPIKVHKGLDNRLMFRVLSPDRTVVNIAAFEQVYARVVNPDNRTIMLEKLCTLGPAKGLIILELDGGDLSHIPPGTFEIVLIRTQEFVNNIPGYYVEKPLYSDLNDNVAMQIEVTEQAFKAPLKAITLYPEDWTPDFIVPVFGPATACFYSSRMPGARILNHIDSVHSFSVKTTRFTGWLQIFGSLEEAPDPYLNDTRWFPVYPSTMSQQIEFINYTGTTAYTFAQGALWYKFRYVPSTQVLNPGTLDKLIFRA